MTQTSMLHVRVDDKLKADAAEKLANVGLTISDAVRILLTRTANEGALPLELVANAEAHDTWFRAKVQEALWDTRPDISDEQAEAHFTGRRAAAREKADAKS